MTMEAQCKTCRRQMRRYQRKLVGILAIESLTSTIRAPAVSLTAQSAASVGQSIIKLEQQLINTQAQIKELTKSLSELEQDEAAQKNKLEDEVARQRNTELAIKDAIARGQAALTTGSTSADFLIKTGDKSSSQNGIDSDDLTGLIKQIVDHIYGANHFDGLCFEAYLKTDAADTEAIAMLKQICGTTRGSIWTNRIRPTMEIDTLDQSHHRAGRRL